MRRSVVLPRRDRACQSLDFTIIVNSYISIGRVYDNMGLEGRAADSVL